jgi:hypothetical protein
MKMHGEKVKFIKKLCFPHYHVGYAKHKGLGREKKNLCPSCGMNSMLHAHISVNAFKVTILYSVVKVKETCLQTFHKCEPIYFVDSAV